MAANLTQILNFKANFHQEFELFSRNKTHATNGGPCSAEYLRVFSATQLNIWEPFLEPFFLKLYCSAINLLISKQ